MDVTLLFKASIKTCRTTNKALGLRDQKTNILKVNPKDANLIKPKAVLQKITFLQDYITKNKAAYLNVINYLSTNKTMTQIDRETIDSTAEEILTNCTTLIKEYKIEISQIAKSSHQKAEHYGNVVESLERYLKNVSKIYTEAKAIRVKRVIEAHKLSKLETKVAPPSDATTPAAKRIVPVTAPHTDNTNDQLSPEEMQMFESENELLFNELNTISDEVRQMESKVVHISELQELFTEKVLQQDKDIDRIATAVVGASSNMTDANEQIRQAIQRNAGLRVWILFFLLVMSFSLLFLDWYND